MKNYLGGLTNDQAATLARIRFATTARLVAVAAEADEELRAKADERRFCLVLSAPGIPSAGISSRHGRVRSWSGRRSKPADAGAASLILRFVNARSAATALGGGRATPLPLPLGPGAFPALSFFRAAARAVPALLRAPGTAPELRARLLAEAALHGLAAVAASDRSLADRLAHVPDGLVAVEAPGAFSLGLAKKGLEIEALETAPERPNARLSFRDGAAAVAVFSGAMPAVVALGLGIVSIRGLLPLVQGLFSVLDRLGSYMAVKSEEPQP